MKKTNKKGFTLVELVIVIAVIAILAGVLIGTFASVISRANQSKAVQQWKAAVDEAYVTYVADNHVAPQSVSLSESQISFANTESSYNSNVLLLNDVYVELDKTYHVYFNWTYDTESQTDNYSVSTTPVGTEAFVTVEVYNKMIEDFKNSGNDWSTMNNHAFDSKQYYIVSSSETFPTADENQKVMLKTVVGENETSFSLVPTEATPAANTTYTYYLVQPFNGVWNSNKWTYSNFEFTPDTTTPTVGTWTLSN